jgi:uncharacterized protein (TIGR03083 family)
MSSIPTSRSGRDDRPRTSTLDRPVLMRLASDEYERFGDLLGALPASDATRLTDCPGWDVRTMASHVLGMAEMAASFRDGRRQQKAAFARGGVFIHALTAVQVDERTHMTLGQITSRFRVVGPKAARARRRLPALVRRRRMPVAQSVGGQDEQWTLGYLMDTIITRDVWMHRLDIANAVGTVPHLTADHDGVLVGDVVREWAARHGEPCAVDLTGVAGGSWTFGSGGPAFCVDAVEFCRTLARREPAKGLLAVEVPF